MDLILDTNIYRNLVRNLTDDQVLDMSYAIKQKCKQDNITLLFPINSAMELIAHFNDEVLSEQQECRSSLNLLVDLSTTYSSTHIHVDFIPPLNAILERLFFETKDKHAKMYSTVVTLSQRLVGNIKTEEHIEMDKNIQAVKSQIEFEKNEIRNNYEDYLKSINNGETDWEYFKDNKQLRRDYFQKLKIGRLSFLVAQSFVDRVYNISEHEIVKDQDYFDKVIKFMQDFCPALIMNELLLENVGHGVQAIKDVADGRWNTVIDISLIFGALYNPKNIDRRLVTEENNIHLAFDNCGFQNKILNLDQFKEMIGI